jgi:hypothetical protein
LIAELGEGFMVAHRGWLIFASGHAVDKWLF